MYVDFTNIEKKPPNIDELKRMCETKKEAQDTKVGYEYARMSMKNASKLTNQY